MASANFPLITLNLNREDLLRYGEVYRLRLSTGCHDNRALDTDQRRPSRGTRLRKHVRGANGYYRDTGR